MVGALALQCLVQHLLHLASELLSDVLLHEVLPHDLVLAEAGDLGGLAVPLVDVPVGVDAEDGRVRSVDQERQVVGDARELRLVVRLVLSYAHDAQHPAVDIGAAREGEQERVRLHACLDGDQEHLDGPRLAPRDRLLKVAQRLLLAELRVVLQEIRESELGEYHLRGGEGCLEARV